jgi:tight adherence protein C
VPLQVFFFALLIVGSVGVCVWALRGVNLDLPTRRRKVVRANLGPSAATGPDLRDVVLSQSAWDRLGVPTIRRAADLGRRISPQGLLDALERRRDIAGLGSRWTTERLLAAKVLLGMTGAFLGFVAFVSNPTALTLLGGALFAGCGFFIIDVYLDAKARERRSQIERAFPNTVDQITICVESGLGLDAAIAHAARTGAGPLADEMTHVLQDIQAGVPRQAALEAMVARMEVSDVRHFVVAIGQANRYGVPVADALRVQATEARERRKSRAEERAQKMAVKLLFPLVFCILPALFVVLLGPAAIRIANMSLAGGS